MGPLSGIRILDLSRLFPGPYASLLLSDLGAEVIKVEDNKGGDYIRYYPPLCEDGNGAAFHALNRGKKSISLDLRDDGDRGRFEGLVKTADVVLESFRPGVLEKLGLGPDRLLELNPRLVVCRISGYGQDGEDRLKAGHDLNYAARAGVLGTAANPSVLPVQVGDLCGGAWPAALQITAALVGRSSSGKGAVIDVSMTDGAQAMLIMPFARRAVSGEDIGAGRDLLAGAVPCYRVYPCKEGHLAVGALEPKFWMAFCSALELSDLMGSGLATGEEGADVQAQVAKKLLEKTAPEWEALLAPFDCCCEAVRSPEEAWAAAQQGDRGLAAEVTVDGQRVPLPAPPLSLARGRPLTPGPGLGQHNDELLG